MTLENVNTLSNATECIDQEEDVEGHNCAETIERTVMDGADNGTQRFPPLCLLLYYPPGPSYPILVTNEDNHAVITAIIPVNKVAGVEESTLDGEV
jgi:hypothetical protein